MNRIHLSAAALLAVCLALCAAFSAPRPAAAAERRPTAPLKVALLPILDAFPFHVARARGYFAAESLAVEAVPVASGLDRDQLMQAGAVDGMLNEISSTASFNRGGPQAVIVAVARRSQPGHPLFRLLATPGSGLSTPRDLAGKAVGISKNTIIEYVTDRLLAAAGLAADAVEKKSVPVIPERYQLLMQGRLPAATLPDPLAAGAMAAGAVSLADDGRLALPTVSVLTFGRQALQARAAEVRAFLRAWDRAAADINAAPEDFRPLLLEAIRVPSNIRDTYRIPPYARRQVPTRDQWEDVMQWMIDTGLLPAPLPWEESVSAAFLPESP